MHCISVTRLRILPDSFIPAEIYRHIRSRGHKAPLVVYKAIIPASARKQMKTKGKEIRMGRDLFACGVGGSGSIRSRCLISVAAVVV